MITLLFLAQLLYLDDVNNDHYMYCIYIAVFVNRLNTLHMYTVIGNDTGDFSHETRTVTGAGPYIKPLSHLFVSASPPSLRSLSLADWNH